MKSTHAHSFLIGLLVAAPAITEASNPDAEAALDRAIRALPPVINGADDARKPELVFRLAELYSDKAALLKAEAMLAHDTAYVRWVEGGQRGEAPKVEAFMGETNAVLRNIAALTKRVLDDYPSYERNDEVLFLLAQTAEALGRSDAAHYATLVRRHPDSRLVPAAYLRLGEIYFTANDLEPARRAYERAYALGSGIDRRVALHKLAWCDFNTQAFGAGIDKLKQVVAEGDDLASEALRDLVRFFAQVDDVARALAYFERHGATREAIQYAGLLDEQYKWPLAVAAYKKILERHPERADVRAALITSLFEVEHYAEIVSEAKKLAAMKAPADAREAIYGVATELHRRGVEPERKDVLAAAAAVYDAHLALFAENADEARFYGAEIAMMLDDPAKAARAYDAVAEGTGRFVVPAAKGAVLAHEKTGEGLVGACDRYVRLAPDAADVAEVRYRAAQALDASDRHAATERFLALAKDHPEHALAKMAARRVTSRLLGEERWADAARVGRQFIAALGRGDEVLVRDVAGADYKSIQAKEERTGALSGTAQELARLEVADDFVRFADENAASGFADEALLSAALLYSGLGRTPRAVETASLLLERHADSEHTARAFLLQAELHERTADFATAARLFAQFASDYPKHPKAPDALFNAGRYFIALDETEAARRVFAAYVDRHGEAPDAPDVYLDLCATYGAEAAAQCLARFERRWPQAPEALRIAAQGARAEALEDAGRTKRAARIRDELVKRWARLGDATRSDPRVRSVTAAAAFARAERDFSTLQRESIGRSVRRLKKKMKLLGSLVCAPSATTCERPGRYVEILEYGDAEYAIAALTRIGDSYQATAEAIEAAPPPRGLTPEQIEIYRAQIATEVAALAARALEAYELAVVTARELGVDGPWVVRAAAALDTTPPRDAPEAEALDDLLVAPIRQADNSTVSR